MNTKQEITREQRMFALLHAVTYLLMLERSGSMKKEQWERARDMWIDDMARLMLEMVTEQEKGAKSDKV